MFEVPGSDVKSVHINEDCVKGAGSPQYMKHSSSLSNSNQPTSPDTTPTTPSAPEEEENTQVRVTQ